MSIEELRSELQPLLDSGRDRIRAYGRQFGVSETFTDVVAAALGEISLQEAYSALEQDALEVKRRNIQSSRSRS